MCLFRGKGSFLKILSSEGRNHGTSYKDAKAVSTGCSFNILGLEKRERMWEGQGAGEEEGVVVGVKEYFFLYSFLNGNHSMFSF